MNIDQVLNDAATWIVYGIAGAAHVLAIMYGVGSPWWRSLLGTTIFAKWLSFVFVLDYLLVRRLWGEFPGYGLVAVLVYGFMFLAFLAVIAEVAIERRSPATEAPVSRSNTINKEKK